MTSDITIHDSSAYYNLRQRVITIYDSLVITTRHRKNSKQCGIVAIDSCFTLLLQFTTDIAIYDDCYYNLRQVLQFTTEQSALNVTPGKNTLLAR